MSVYILPVILVALLVYSLIKRVKIYDCFLDGGKESLALVKTIFPYIAAVFVAIELFRASGLSEIVSGWLAVPLSYIGIPANCRNWSCWFPCPATEQSRCSKR